MLEEMQQGGVFVTYFWRWFGRLFIYVCGLMRFYLSLVSLAELSPLLLYWYFHGMSFEKYYPKSGNSFEPEKALSDLDFVRECWFRELVLIYWVHNLVVFKILRFFHVFPWSDWWRQNCARWWHLGEGLRALIMKLRLPRWVMCGSFSLRTKSWGSY